MVMRSVEKLSGTSFRVATLSVVYGFALAVLTLRLLILPLDLTDLSLKNPLFGEKLGDMY